MTNGDGDDRGAVYAEEGVTVYRASSLNRCVRCLVGLRLGFEAQAAPEKLQAVFARGHRVEDEVVDFLTSGLMDWSITGRQDVIELDVGGVVIRGHLDGRTTTPPPDVAQVPEALLEIKSCADASWIPWTTQRWEGKDDWELQTSVYQHATGLPMLIVAARVVEQKWTGELDFYLQESPRIPLADIEALVEGIEAQVATGMLLEFCSSKDWACFVAGSLVLTEEGYRPIEDLQVGQRVLTHQARWMPITAVQKTPNQLVRRVGTYQSKELVCTDDHPFLTLTREYHTRTNRGGPQREFVDTGWLQAEKLTRGHFVKTVLPPVSESAPQGLSVDQWWIVGRWLADGYRGKSGTYISCGNHKRAELESHLQAAGVRVKPYLKRTATEYRLTGCLQLVEVMKDFGKLAHGKRLPGYAFCLDEFYARALIEGYLSGDGHLGQYGDAAEPHWLASSVSRELAYGLALIAQRGLGVLASTAVQKRSTTSVIEGRTVNQRPFSYVLRLPSSTRRSKNAWKDAAGDWWGPVWKNEPLAEAQDVYNISVAEDESYLVQGVVVHNCPLWYLCSYAEDSTPPDAAPDIDELAAALDHARTLKKPYEELEKTLRRQIDDALGDKDGVKTSAWSVQRVTRAIGSLDKDKMTADGIDLSSYEKTTLSSSVRVTRRKDRGGASATSNPGSADVPPKPGEDSEVQQDQPDDGVLGLVRGESDSEQRSEVDSENALGSG